MSIEENAITLIGRDSLLWIFSMETQELIFLLSRYRDIRDSSRRISRMKQIRNRERGRKRMYPMLSHRQRAREWQANAVANKWALRSVSARSPPHHPHSSIIMPDMSVHLWSCASSSSTSHHHCHYYYWTRIMSKTLKTLWSFFLNTGYALLFLILF